MSSAESFHMATYLLTSEESAMNESNIERVLPGVLASRAMHMVPAYEVMSL